MKKTYEVVLDCVDSALMSCEHVPLVNRVEIKNQIRNEFMSTGAYMAFSGNATKGNVREVVNTWILPQFRKKNDPLSLWMKDGGVDVMKEVLSQAFKEG